MSDGFVWYKIERKDVAVFYKLSFVTKNSVGWRFEPLFSLSFVKVKFIYVAPLKQQMLNKVLYI